MRLWHQDLINRLPRQQLLGQHRECCALRGNGWGKPHATVNYVFKHDYSKLFEYHLLIMNEMANRGYNVDVKWLNYNYRGKVCEILSENKMLNIPTFKVYNEHNDQYLKECLDNLRLKGIVI